MQNTTELTQIIKKLSNQRDEILPEIEKLPKEYAYLISKFKLISDTLAQLQHQFDDLVQTVPHKK